MTLAQIMSIIALLVAFEAPPEVVQNVQTVLLDKVTVERIAPTVVFTEPITQKIPMKELKVHHSITGPHSKEDKTVHVTFSVIAFEDKKQVMDEDIVFVAPDGSEKTVSTSVIGRVIKNDPTMHKGSQFHWDIPLGTEETFTFKWRDIMKTTTVSGDPQ